MPYLTVRATPRTHQITLEEILTCSVPQSAFFNPDPNTADTVTRWVDDWKLMERTKFLEQFDFHGMIEKLRRFCNTYDHLYQINREDLYYTFYIPKEKGGYRRIDAPVDELMEALRVLKSIFESNFKPLYHTNAFAYIPKRCARDAVEKHQKNKSRWFLHTDFSNFFGSTTPAFLYSSLTKIFPFSQIVKYRDGDEFLRRALDLCFLNGGLPQGTPISPYLTNVMMIPIDHMLAKICRERQMQDKYFVYTRYADDIHFSCKYHFRYTEVVDKVNEVCQRFGAPFKIKEEKTHYGSSAGRNFILGLVLNKENEITVGHKKKKRYKSSLFNFIMDSKNGIVHEPGVYQEILGKSSYYLSQEPEYFEAIHKMYNEKFNVDVIQMLKDACAGHPTGLRYQF